MYLKFDPIEEKLNIKLDKFFNKKNLFIKVGNVVITKKFEEIGEKILNLTTRQTDVFLVSYPRTGSTWTQEMIWLLGNNLNYEGAEKLQQFRSPLLELTALLAYDHNEWLTNSIGNSVDMIKNMPGPRFIKSHLPLPLLPISINLVKPKIIYIARNPKDLCVSYYYYCKSIHNLTCTFEEFCELILTHNAPLGNIWTHILGFWEKRHEPNILFLKYEDMKRDLKNVIKQCATFMEVDESLLTPENLDKLCDHLNFDKMKKNPAVNLESIVKSNDNLDNNLKFIRKGQVGDWKNIMTPQMSERFDSWIEENTKGTGLNFVYE